MKNGNYFYNFEAVKEGVYSKFNYGVLEIKCAKGKVISLEAWDEMKALAKKEYPDADSINFTAFNKV